MLIPATRLGRQELPAKEEEQGVQVLMVGAAGLEPATLCLEGRCSIHLSYAPT